MTVGEKKYNNQIISIYSWNYFTWNDNCFSSFSKYPAFIEYEKMFWIMSYSVCITSWNREYCQTKRMELVNFCLICTLAELGCILVTPHCDSDSRVGRIFRVVGIISFDLQLLQNISWSRFLLCTLLSFNISLNAQWFWGFLFEKKNPTAYVHLVDFRKFFINL